MKSGRINRNKNFENRICGDRKQIYHHHKEKNIHLPLMVLETVEKESFSCESS